MNYVVRQGKRIKVGTIGTAVPARRKRAPAKETFARIPHERGMELYGRIGGAAWVILLELDRLIFKSFGRNVNNGGQGAAALPGRRSALDGGQGAAAEQWTKERAVLIDATPEDEKKGE